MRVSDLRGKVVLKKTVDSKIGTLPRYDQNPFLLLPSELPMVAIKNLVLSRFVNQAFELDILTNVSRIGGFLAIDDIVDYYSVHLAPKYGGFFGLTRIPNDRSREMRAELMTIHWTAGQIAVEYDRQHGRPGLSVNTGDKEFDDVVNDILQRHGKEAAIAYVLGLKEKAGARNG